MTAILKLQENEKEESGGSTITILLLGEKKN